jgi:hypothetical protein
MQTVEGKPEPTPSGQWPIQRLFPQYKRASPRFYLVLTQVQSKIGQQQWRKQIR